MKKAALLEQRGKLFPQKDRIVYETDIFTDSKVSTVVSMPDDILMATEAAQEPQAQRLHLLESVVRYVNDAVLITEAAPVDQSGSRVVYVNPAFVQMTGYEAHEIIGKTPRLLQGANTNRRTLAHIHERFYAGKSFIVELLNYRKNGEPFWVEISAHTVNNDAGVCTHWIAIQRDISERKNAEEERAAQVRRDRAFVKEVLHSVTGKKLELCDSDDELPLALPEGVTIPLDSAADLASLRAAVRRVADCLNFLPERVNDLCYASGEAAMNALVHAKRGVAYLRSNPQTGELQIWVRDEGGGIAPEYIHRATLEQGFTTGNSLGYGFKMILSVVDKVYLRTTAQGTTVVICLNRDSPDPTLPAGTR